MPEPFPTVYWAEWDSDATFDAGETLPPESAGRLWAVLMFVFYGDKVALADIENRGLTIPSGHIEPGETLDEAAVREAWEEVGANLDPARRRLIGCYRLTPRSGSHAGQTRYCPVLAAEAFSFAPIPAGSESRGLILAAWEDVADLYFTWDPLMAAVFEFARARKEALFPVGVSLNSILG